MNRLSKERMQGGCQATRSAVPSHSIVPVRWLGSPRLSIYTSNSVKISSFRVQALQPTHAIITEQELVFVRPEHTHGPTRLTCLCKLLQSRVFLLRDDNALETTLASTKASPIRTKRRLTLRDP
ncbi:hypothetical protein BDM02DRAFT_3118854 [Thelephora ganbajun]|uniref:Uncharacterized protein n=1 Tax=Thelephora ganbajun TaxID=370292 RepID=A0ACB6Z9R9_THEGA|nr:hypothetical protein BDM02DRAFT_3118854 [Thelephora ganbajun]